LGLQYTRSYMSWKRLLVPKQNVPGSVDVSIGHHPAPPAAERRVLLEYAVLPPAASAWFRGVGLVATDGEAVRTPETFRAAVERGGSGGSRGVRRGMVGSRGSRLYRYPSRPSVTVSGAGAVSSCMLGSDPVGVVSNPSNKATTYTSVGAPCFRSLVSVAGFGALEGVDGLLIVSPLWATAISRPLPARHPPEASLVRAVKQGFRFKSCLGRISPNPPKGRAPYRG
jgi:hypothetical protein